MTGEPSDRLELGSVRGALAGALSVLVAGFGALNVLYIAGLGDNNLPGLYTFRAATVGDGILLPALAYALIRASGPQTDRTRRDRWLIGAAGATGVVAGALTQWSWLADPNPRLNWTLPAAHTFNTAGWYHAAFLTVASGFFAGAAVSVYLSLRRSTRRVPATSVDRVRTIGAIGVLAPAPAFFFLLLQDNGAFNGWSGRLAVAGMAAVMVVVVGTAVGRQAMHWGVIAVVTALMPAAGLCLLFPPNAIVTLVAVLTALAAGMAGACASSVTGLMPPAARLGTASAAIACAAGPVFWKASEAHVSLAELAIALVCSAVLTGVFVAGLRLLVADKSTSRWSATLMAAAMVPMVAFALTGRYFLQDRQSAEAAANIVGTVAAVFIVGVAARVVRHQFDPVIHAEESDASPEKISALKWRAYLAILTAYSAALLALIVFTRATIGVEDWIPGATSRGAQQFVVLGGCLLVAGALLWIAAYLPPTPGAAVATLVSLSWAVVMGAVLADGYGSWWQILLSALAACLSGVFVYEGVISNIAYLHNLPVDWRVGLVALSAGLAVACSTAWMSGPALQSTAGVQTAGAGLVGLVVVFVACAAVPTLAARTLAGSAPPKQYTIAHPIAALLQDCFLVTLLAISIAWVPIFFLAHTRTEQGWWGPVISYLALLSAAYVYVLGNNTGHVTRERKRVAARAHAHGVLVSPDEHRALGGLSRHVQRQNRLAVFALFPLGIWVIGTEVSGFDKGGLSQFWKRP